MSKRKTETSREVPQKFKVSVLGCTMLPVRYRFFKKHYDLQDDDLMTEAEFNKKRKEMFGKNKEAI